MNHDAGTGIAKPVNRSRIEEGIAGILEAIVVDVDHPVDRGLLRRVAHEAQMAFPGSGCGKTGVAAIGSLLAGAIHGLRVLFEGIEDRQSNMTRFLICF